MPPFGTDVPRARADVRRARARVRESRREVVTGERRRRAGAWAPYAAAADLIARLRQRRPLVAGQGSPRARTPGWRRRQPSSAPAARARQARTRSRSRAEPAGPAEGPPPRNPARVTGSPEVPGSSRCLPRPAPWPPHRGRSHQAGTPRTARQRSTGGIARSRCHYAPPWRHAVVPLQPVHQGALTRPQALPCAVTTTLHAAERPNRSYRIGTTTMFSAVELSRPNRITIAIGA